MKRLFFLNIVLVLSFYCYADTHPTANFGVYGIEKLNTLSEYQKKYVGQTVTYIPEYEGGSYVDNENFLKKGGKYNTEYIIDKISGNDEKMTFYLIEKNGTSKVKMIINNGITSNTVYGKNTTYRIVSSSYTVPLLLSDKFKIDRQNLIGKNFPSNSESPKLEIIDMIIKPVDKINTNYSEYTYPKIHYVIKNNITNKNNEYEASPNLFNALNDIGKSFTNPKYKHKYVVIDIFWEKGNGIYQEKYFMVENTITGEKKKILAKNAETAFEGDDLGVFVATLNKVEKTSNSTNNYGKTVVVEEKDITKFRFSDNNIDILIFCDLKDFCFTIKNTSDNTIKIVWNEAVFVDVNGSTSKIMHSGIKYSEKEKDQQSSILIKGAKLEDVATPINRVYYNNTTRSWMTDPLYLNASKIRKDQTIKLMLPIQIKDVINEYIFEFNLIYRYIHPELLQHTTFNVDLKTDKMELKQWNK